MKDWYKPSEINYSKEQLVNFLLPNLIELRRGNYPDESSCYTSPEYKSWRIMTEAYFAEACCIAGEIDARIAQTPGGCVLLDRYTFNMNDKMLSRKYRIELASIDFFISMRLKYIAGRKRKTVPFRRWLQKKFYMIK